jgi:DNA-directed RNA polymerase
MATYIGKSLGHRGTKAAVVGALGIDLLRYLPVFGIGEGGALTINESADDLAEFLDEIFYLGVASNPHILPTTEPSIPWVQVETGVVPREHWARIPIVDRHQAILNVWRRAIADGRMKDALAALNYLKGTWFTINVPVLRLLEKIVLPSLPPAPSSDMTPGEKWRAKKRLSQARAQQSKWLTALKVAQHLADQPRFRVEQRLDFRGRLIPLPHFNYTREDMVRALYLFADGERIGLDGILWLKAYVAACADGNTWSNNKKPSRLSHDDRIAWTNANLERLYRIGRALIDGAELLDDDLPMAGDPYSFAAACIELAQAVGEGPEFKPRPNFITRLPLSYDGTCNGMQHFCALTRAEQGRYVNLIPSGHVEDFYSHVAAVVYETCSDLMQGPDDRAIVKPGCMTYFYGSKPGWTIIETKKDRKARRVREKATGKKERRVGRWVAYGMTEQVAEILRERGQKAKGAHRLAKAILAAIETLVPSAKEVRAFLERITELYADAGKQFRWVTACGLPVLNYYLKQIIKPVNSRVADKRVRMNRVVGETAEVRKRKAIQAVAPNFIHSCDGAHLCLVTLAAEAEGIRMVTVHDSYACLAPRARRFNEILKQQFIRTHEFDWFGAVLERARLDLPGVDLPSKPKFGTMDLNQIINACPFR